MNANFLLNGLPLISIMADSALHVKVHGEGITMEISSNGLLHHVIAAEPEKLEQPIFYTPETAEESTDGDGPTIMPGAFRGLIQDFEEQVYTHPNYTRPEGPEGTRINLGKRSFENPALKVGSQAIFITSKINKNPKHKGVVVFGKVLSIWYHHHNGEYILIKPEGAHWEGRTFYKRSNKASKLVR